MARDVLSYFLRNPAAADRLEGIARWHTGHAFVITGLSGDGTLAATHACIFAPWCDITGITAAATSDPAPGGPSTRHLISFRHIAAQLPPRDGLSPTPAWLTLLHARDNTARVAGRVACAATSTQSLGADIRPMAFLPPTGQ